jgi:diadenosine tetraphosphatase ApaH/serine/threonine PP2A family protein phosphatase
MFDFLTLSVVIDDRIFCVHGGQSSHTSEPRHMIALLPPLTRSFAFQGFRQVYTESTRSRSSTALEVCENFCDVLRLSLISRALISLVTEIPHEGPMADLVWSDPDQDKEEFAISPRYVVE